MTTAILSRKSTKSPRNIGRERVFVDIPKADMMFFQLFADKMGWAIEETKEELLNKFIATRPKDVPLTDEDVMNMVREVRYGKA